MHTHSTPPTPGMPPIPAARSETDAPAVQALVLRGRLPPETRRVLTSAGVRIVAVRGPGFVGPAIDYVVGPPPGRAPEWLEADEAEDLVTVLRAMERRRGTPQWVEAVLSRHRCGELLLADGSVELTGLLEPRRLVAALLG